MKSILLFASLSAITSYTAQSLPEAITKTENENFEKATADFRSLLSKDATKGDVYFFTGENFFKSGEIDSARKYYQKGIEVNATYPLNYIGAGKVLLADNKVAEAKTQFFKASTLGGPKNAEVARETSEAWLATDNKDADEALKMAQLAVKLDAKNPENHIALGDAQLEKNPTDGSAPVKSYQTATNLNPKNTKGILREGKLYQRGRNYPLALEYYKKAIGLNPSFAPAYREIAELYTLAGQPSKAIENWKKYLEINDSEFARYRYMSALFSNKQYPEAVAEYENLKKTNFKSLYLERLAGYSYAEMGNKTDTAAYSKGLKAINTFFEMAGPNFKYIANDYKYKGLLLARAGKDSLGLIEMNKAIALDSSSAGEIYSTLADIAMKKKDYENVVKYLDKKSKGNYQNLNINDCFDLGKANYFLAAAKQRQSVQLKNELIKKKKQPVSPEILSLDSSAMKSFANADSAFKRMTQLNANWPWGYTWRGRANASLDPDAKSDTTKAMYEKVLSLVKPEERTTTYKANVIEAHEYLGYYYVTKKDDAKAKEQWQMVKELDPTNEKMLNYLSPKKPQGGAKPAPAK